MWIFPILSMPFFHAYCSRPKACKAPVSALLLRRLKSPRFSSAFETSQKPPFQLCFRIFPSTISSVAERVAWHGRGARHWGTVWGTAFGWTATLVFAHSPVPTPPHTNSVAERVAWERAEALGDSVGYRIRLDSNPRFRSFSCYHIPPPPHSVAERVAWERGEALGDSVGYRIRLDSNPRFRSFSCYHIPPPPHSVAERVAWERGEALGDSVGYRIRLDRNPRFRSFSCYHIPPPPHSVAERVAWERGEALGDSVGYRIRLDSNPPRARGSILFCTVGILLRRMQVCLCGGH
ncbi:unnamed protein product [Closterium sp. NIES-65]|nr:unnamed protein product [Closterium sp. NIES-65]